MAKRNYRDEIDAAVKRGDYVTAGYLENERNKKIDNEKLPYEKTNDYASYLNKDYGDDILEGIRSNNPGAVASATKYRDEKASLPGYTQYADDAIANKGKAYTELNTILNTPFTYNNGKAQLDARQKELDMMIDNIRNYKDFEYNRDADPRYAELAKMYTRNGQRAMSDTLGEISARTGGLASSYAATAGNQAYANYMTELGDKALDLEKLAYQMYDDKYNRDLQALSLAQNRYESDLARFNNDRNFAYGQYGDNRNMAYNRMRDMTAGERYADEMTYNRAWNEDERTYNRGRDTKTDEWAKMQWDYGVADDEYNKNLAKAQTLGQAGNFDAYKDLGYSDDEINSLKKAYADARALEIMKATKSSGGGGKKVADKVSAKYDDVVDELWGETDPAVIDETLKRYVASKSITEAEAEEIRATILDSEDSSVSKSPSLSEKAYTILHQADRMLNNNASPESVLSYLEKVEDRLSSEDIDYIFNALDQRHKGWNQ